jgi:ribose/xylose/arabinose/galactoside ABC-type transport system permease subunit
MEHGWLHSKLYEGLGLTAEIVRGASYVFAGALCFFATAIESGERKAYARMPWVWLGLGMLLLAIAAAEWWNLGQMVADAGRSEAREEGWYRDRRPIQAFVICGMAAVITGTWIAARARAPKEYGRYWPVISIAVALLGFVIIRGISLHALDAAFNEPVLGVVRAGDLIEIAGAGAISAAALVLVILRPPPGDQPRISAAR